MRYIPRKKLVKKVVKRIDYEKIRDQLYEFKHHIGRLEDEVRFKRYSLNTYSLRRMEELLLDVDKSLSILELSIDSEEIKKVREYLEKTEKNVKKYPKCLNDMLNKYLWGFNCTLGTFTASLGFHVLLTRNFLASLIGAGAMTFALLAVPPFSPWEIGLKVGDGLNRYFAGRIRDKAYDLAKELIKTTNKMIYTLEGR